MYQKIIIIGNLGKDPETRNTPAGKVVTSFNVATNREWTNGAGEKVKETAWFRVTTWDKSAEACGKYLKKGSKVAVEGRLVCDPITGGPKVFSRSDGTSGASFEISATEVKFLSAATEGSNGNTAAAPAEEAPAEEVISFN